ncbi:sulfotransferase 6B1-like [Xenopus laevis]|uniref:Sulfotransferase n=1 Tax=Xenopus laevis TaxID=8355 RepID=A0A8J1KMY4_XENLA|nr:sulfotransferase 6B1-like [Xenopus laevis]
MSGMEESTSSQEKFLGEMEKVQGKAKGEIPEDLVLIYKGILYPSFMCSEETFHALECFEAREDDLLVVTYPKCGTNWVFQILNEMLLFSQVKVPSIYQAMLEFGKPGKIQSLKEASSPRVFATHLHYRDIPKSFFEKKVKTLLILRNPKDTAVSYFHFSNNNPVLSSYGSWDLFFNDYINGKVCYGSFFDHSLAWGKHIDDESIMAITYEDMKLDYATYLKKISDFFGFSLSEEQLVVVENKTTFKSMKENSEGTHGKLGNTFFRKGEIGDWKSLFTEAQSKAVDAKFEQHLAGTKLGEKLNYKKYCEY